MQKIKCFQTLNYLEVFVEFKYYLLNSPNEGTIFCAVYNQAKNKQPYLLELYSLISSNKREDKIRETKIQRCVFQMKGYEGNIRYSSIVDQIIMCWPFDNTYYQCNQFNYMWNLNLYYNRKCIIICLSAMISKFKQIYCKQSQQQKQTK